MVELKQKNPDFVTQEELEKFLNDYEDYIYKFQNINNDQQRFLFFLKKHRDIIEDVIKGISKIQLNVYAVTSINDHNFNQSICYFQFRLKDNKPVIFEINARFSGTTPIRFTKSFSVLTTEPTLTNT